MGWAQMTHTTLRTTNLLMAYFIDLFAPETYETFTSSNREISGFRIRQKGAASRVKPGDTLICYVTKFSRWCGLLDIVEGPFIDSTPIFAADADPFVVRFKVRARVWLPLEMSPSIYEGIIWKQLSFTSSSKKNSKRWVGLFRSSLSPLNEVDGKHLESILFAQLKSPTIYPFDERDAKMIARHTVKRVDKVVSISVPRDTETHPPSKVTTELKLPDAIRIQSLIAQAGAKMGMSIWVPNADRDGVLKEWQGKPPKFLDSLPLNYNDITLKTIEQIDVLWLSGRVIIRAFEIEHTASIYSGILRMADLLALQPNLDIRLHIVTPADQREKVFFEIRRPVFSLLEKGPLADNCTYLSYDSILDLAAQKHLAHLTDTVLDEYAEKVE